MHDDLAGLWVSAALPGMRRVSTALRCDAVTVGGDTPTSLSTFWSRKLASIPGSIVGRTSSTYGFLTRISPRIDQTRGCQVLAGTDVDLEYLPDAIASGKSM